MSLHPVALRHPRPPLGPDAPRLDPARLVSFVPRAGLAIWLQLDLRESAFAQIDFWDRACARLILHLSLRREAGCIVVNRWGVEGWRREWPLPARLGPRLHELELCFSADGLGGLKAELVLDGARLGLLDRWPARAASGRMGLRRGFPALDQIAQMTWPAALHDLHVRDPARTDAHLAEDLSLLWPGASGRARLRWGRDDETLSLLPSPGRFGTGARAFLPGRLWQDAGDGPLQLHLEDTRATATLTLKPAQICDLLEGALGKGYLPLNARLQLQAIEHLHHAKLWDQASERVIAALAPGLQCRGVARMGPRHSRALPDLAAKAPSLKARDDFHAAIGAGRTPAPLPLFTSLAAPLTRDERAQLALFLSEWFCAHADPLALARAAAPVPAWALRGDLWADTAMLPMLWAAGQAQDILALLTMHKASAGWLVTPALGWLARRLGADPGYGAPAGIGPELRTQLIIALLELIRAQAERYGTQIACEGLIEGILDLLRTRPFLPDCAQDKAITLIWESYALCPAFWDRLAERPVCAGTAPLVARAAQVAHLRAAHGEPPGPESDAATAPFLRDRVAGHARLRRLALTATWPRATDHAPAEHEELALRWLALPRSDPACIDDAAAMPALHAAACRGLMRAAAHVTRPDYGAAARQLGAQMHALLRPDRSAALSDVELAEVLHRASLMLGPTTRNLGAAALLALAEAQHRRGHRDQAGRIIAHLAAAWRALPDHAPDGAALAHALMRFRACCDDPMLTQPVSAAFGTAGPAPCPRDPQARALWQAANPLADTLVALISCRPNLAGRVAQARAAWGDLLAARGIPLITVIGRPRDARVARTTFDGAILALDAPDDYEGLPQKTRALIDWVRTETGFARLLKIDDDCFLNVPAFFDDLSYLGCDYYGRPLQRAQGEMDRAWHMDRACTRRGQGELDKSPEPAVYADGSTGYLLTRSAMDALRDAAESPAGQALEATSFMEDKLVGDLLALRGIRVEGPNYDTAIFRKTRAGLPPLSQYESSFLPFAGAPIKLAHLDDGAAQAGARAALAEPMPRTQKIWPSFRSARTGWACDALDLVSPPARLSAARAAAVAAVAVMRNERFMLDHFLSHYRRLGVTAFLIADNGSDDGTLEHLLDQPDVSVFTTDTPYSQSNYGVAWQEALMAHFRAGRWSLVADADELAFWHLPDARGHVAGDLPALLAQPDFAQAEAVKLSMLDCYPGHPLSQTHFTTAPFLEADHIDRAPLRDDWQGRGPWGNSATVTSNLRHRLLSGPSGSMAADLFVAQKFALLKYHPLMQLSNGLHYITGARVAPRPLAFAHFKYHAHFHAKARAEAARGQHFNNATEYRAYLALMAEGRDILHDPEISVPLRDCPLVQQICAAHSAR